MLKNLPKSLSELHLYLKIKSLTEDIGRYIPRNELTRNINFDKNLMGITLYYWIAKDIKKIALFDKGYDGYRVHLRKPLVITKNNRDIAKIINPSIYDVINCIPLLRREYQEWKKNP